MSQLHPCIWLMVSGRCLFIQNPDILTAYAFVFLKQPKVVSDIDELELAKQLERLEAENAEVAGDDDNSDMDDEGSGEEGDWVSPYLCDRAQILHGSYRWTAEASSDYAETMLHWDDCSRPITLRTLDRMCIAYIFREMSCQLFCTFHMVKIIMALQSRTSTFKLSSKNDADKTGGVLYLEQEDVACNTFSIIKKIKSNRHVRYVVLVLCTI